MLKDYIEERATSTANNIIERGATVRETAKAFGVSKSTVHKDCAERLYTINPGLAKRVRQVLDVNKSERHIRAAWLQKKNICICMEMDKTGILPK